MRFSSSLILLSCVSTSLARPTPEPLLEEVPVVGKLLKGIVGPWGLVGSTLHFPTLEDLLKSGGLGSRGITGIDSIDALTGDSGSRHRGNHRGNSGSGNSGSGNSGSGNSGSGSQTGNNPWVPPSEVKHRTVVYMQSNSDPDRLRGAATHLIVAAIHLNEDSVHINDTPYQETKIWDELKVLAEGGMVITGLLGGAGVGSYARLDRDFETYYDRLRAMITYTGLQGLDLDPEERVSLNTLVRLVRSLRSDFGPTFLITCSPVPAGLTGTDQWGTTFGDLENEVGDEIAWYNTQFYCNHGVIGSASYMDTVQRSGIPASKIVAGTLTNPANCGAGYVDFRRLTTEIIPAIREASGEQVAGIAGWEYFNSVPGGTRAPERWAQGISDALNRPL